MNRYWWDHPGSGGIWWKKIHFQSHKRSPTIGMTALVWHRHLCFNAPIAILGMISLEFQTLSNRKLLAVYRHFQALLSLARQNEVMLCTCRHVNSPYHPDFRDLATLCALPRTHSNMQAVAGKRVWPIIELMWMGIEPDSKPNLPLTENNRKGGQSLG